ncbi:MAG: zf-HC2 domain-containing protein [Gemmatimonadetes bacterium]|nr:zf-HC2 domain-containing protein [Gemmatimonadota bacterium]
MSKTKVQACSEFLAVFSEFVEGTLGRKRESEIRAHLDCCEGCLRHLRAYRKGVGTLQAMEDDPFGGVGPDEFYARLEERLRRGGSWGGLEPSPSGTTLRPERWSPRVPATALAAAVMLALMLLANMQGTRRPSASAPVSIASVIPTVWAGGTQAGEDLPEVTRARSARNTVPRIGRSVAQGVRHLRVESLEGEFGRIQSMLRQGTGWVYAPIRGGAGALALETTEKTVSPAELTLEAALALP